MSSTHAPPAGRKASAYDPSPVNAFLGRRLAEQRDVLSLSRGAVAAQVNIDASTLGQYEQGFLTVPDEVLYALSKTLRLSLHDLFAIDSKKAAE